MDLLKQNFEQIKWGRKNSQFFYGFLLSLLLTHCAVVGVNNFQNAETIGKNKVKIGLPGELGREMDEGISIDNGNIKVSQQNQKWTDYMYPIIGLAIQYGITDATDIRIGLSSTIFPIVSPSAALYLKKNIVHTTENFAIAIMTGCRVYGSTTENSGKVSFNIEKRYEEKNEYLGYLIDIPIIISTRSSFLSIHFSPRYMYTSLNIKADYKEFNINDDRNILHNMDEKTICGHTYGISTGLVFTLLEDVEICPEISILHFKNLLIDSYQWVPFPGLDISLKF